MKKTNNRGARPQPVKVEANHFENARRLVWDAISEINQSGKAMYLARELGDLYHIEDTLWQFATVQKAR